MVQSPVEHIPGGLGAVGLVTEGSHCLHIVLGPFAGCDSLFKIAQCAYGLEDVVLMGITVAIVILVGSIMGIVYSGIKLIRTLIAVIGMVRFSQNGSQQSAATVADTDVDPGPG